MPSSLTADPDSSVDGIDESAGGIDEPKLIHHGVVPQFTLTSVYSIWMWSPVGVALSVLFSFVYAFCMLAARRRGGKLSVLRAVAFYALGVGSLVLATDGGLAVYRGVSFVAAAAQSGVLASVTPIGIALGDPVGVLRQAFGSGDIRWLHRVLTARTSRVLMFPAFASLLAVGVHLGLFVTPWLATSLLSGWGRELTYMALLGSGLLFVLPLLGDQEMLPVWCTPPIRVVIAFADGLLDALPGVVLMAWPRLLGPPVPAYLAALDPLWQQQLGGGVMFALAELVGLPLLAAVVRRWVRSEDRVAKEVDAALDLAQGQKAQADPASVETDRPWWHDDPRFAGRFRP